MITNSAFGWTTGDVVLDAIAFENFCLAAVHPHRNRHNELPLCGAQDVAQRLIQFEIIRGAIELLFSDFKRIEFLLKGRCRGHKYLRFRSKSSKAALS